MLGVGNGARISFRRQKMNNVLLAGRELCLQFRPEELSPQPSVALMCTYRNALLLVQPEWCAKEEMWIPPHGSVGGKELTLYAAAIREARQDFNLDDKSIHFARTGSLGLHRMMTQKGVRAVHYVGLPLTTMDYFEVKDYRTAHKWVGSPGEFHDMTVSVKEKEPELHAALVHAIQNAHSRGLIPWTV